MKNVFIRYKVLILIAAVTGIVTGLLFVAVSKKSESDIAPQGIEMSLGSKRVADALSVVEGDKSGELPEQIISGLFVMKASVADSSGSSGEFIIDFISEDEFQLSGVFSGQQIAYVVSGGFAYINNGGQWARTSAGGVESLFSIEDLSLSKNDYQQFKGAARFVGVTECAAGTCDAWEAEILRDDLEQAGPSDYARVFVLKDTRQIARVEAATADASTATVTYDYRTLPVVRPPANFTDLEIPGL